MTTKTQHFDGLIVTLAARGDLSRGQHAFRKPPGCDRDRAVECATLAECANQCRLFIKHNALGAGNWAGGHITHAGEEIARVAYNGRVFGRDGKEIKLKG